MPSKTARSGSRKPLGWSGMPLAIQTSHSGFRAIRKIGTIQASSDIIRGIPDIYNYPLAGFPFQLTHLGRARACFGPGCLRSHSQSQSCLTLGKRAAATSGKSWSYTFSKLE